MSEQRFAERFGTLLLDRGWHCLPHETVSEYEWKDRGWVALRPWDSYNQRTREHIEIMRSSIDWPALQESDFEIGWWNKFCGTFTDNDRVQLIKVAFPLSTPLRSSPKLSWAAELSLSEAISAVCTGMTVKD